MLPSILLRWQLEQCFCFSCLMRVILTSRPMVGKWFANFERGIEKPMKSNAPVVKPESIKVQEITILHSGISMKGDLARLKRLSPKWRPSFFNIAWKRLHHSQSCVLVVFGYPTDFSMHYTQGACAHRQSQSTPPPPPRPLSQPYQVNKYQCTVSARLRGICAHTKETRRGRSSHIDWMHFFFGDDIYCAKRSHACAPAKRVVVVVVASLCFGLPHAVRSRRYVKFARGLKPSARVVCDFNALCHCGTSSWNCVRIPAHTYSHTHIIWHHTWSHARGLYRAHYQHHHHHHHHHTTPPSETCV